MNVFIGLFLIAHGLIHASYMTPKPDDPNYPFDFTKGWFTHLVGSVATPIGMTLAVLAVGCFALAGLGVLGVPGLDHTWKLFVTGGAISSTVLLALFWHPWLILGFVINAVLLYGIYVLHWTWR